MEQDGLVGWKIDPDVGKVTLTIYLPMLVFENITTSFLILESLAECYIYHLQLLQIVCGEHQVPPPLFVVYCVKAQ